MKKNKDEKNKEVNDITISFSNESLTDCIDQENIPEKLSDPEQRDEIEKCLKSKDKLFLH